MDLSIVIVNWNTEELLRDCLQTVFAGLGPLEAEVLVVDNASSDGSVAMVKGEFPGVRLIETTRNLGFAAGNNVALRLAKGRHVMLLNTDTLVHGDVLPEAVAWLDAHPEVGVMGPRVLNADGTVQPSCSAFPSLKFLAMQTFGLTRIARLDGYRMTGWDRASERRVDVISGAAMVVRRAAMEEVGLLDRGVLLLRRGNRLVSPFRRAGWELRLRADPRDHAISANGSPSGSTPPRRADDAKGTTRSHRKQWRACRGHRLLRDPVAANISRAGLWSALLLPRQERRPGRAGPASSARFDADLPKAMGPPAARRRAAR